MKNKLLPSRLRLAEVCCFLSLCIGIVPDGRAVSPDTEPEWEKAGSLLWGGTSRIERARRLEREGRWKAAAKLYRKLAKSARHPANQAYALERCADCFLNAEKFYTAYVHYKKLIDEHPLFVKQAHVLTQLRNVAAAFDAGRSSLFHFKNPALAAQVFDIILRLAPAGPHAADDMLELARYQEKTGDIEEAAATCRDLLRRHPERAEARLRLAGLILKQSRAGDGDGRLRREARSELEQFLTTNPTGPDAPLAKSMLTLVRETLARDRFVLGRFYSRRPHRRPAAARRYLHDVLVQYRETAVAPIAKAVLAQLGDLPQGPQTGPAPKKEPSTGVVTGAGLSGPKSTARHERTEPPTPVQPRIGPPEAVPFPKNAQWIKQQEKVKKWLLPLEDVTTGDTKDAPH